MNKIDLKPCPFCGGEAKFEDISTEDETYFMIQCTTEECSAGVCFADNSITKAKAASAWNRRHHSTVVNQFGQDCKHITNEGHITIRL